LSLGEIRHIIDIERTKNISQQSTYSTEKREQFSRTIPIKRKSIADYSGEEASRFVNLREVQ